MTKEEILKELKRLKAVGFGSDSANIEKGYGIGINDAIDMVEKLPAQGVSEIEEEDTEFCPMDTEKAVRILEAHQAWRRDESVPPKPELQSPYLIGIAMDVLIAHAKATDVPIPKCNVCDNPHPPLHKIKAALREIEKALGK